MGRHTARLRDLLVARNIPSRIYVEMIDPETESECRPFSSYAEDSAPGDVLVYQFATASDMAPWLLARTEPLVVNYHNITPPEHYAPWDNGLARHQLRAQAELSALAPRTALGIAMSAFNEAELCAVGYTNTAVVPPAAMLPTEHVRRHERGGASSGARWLSVGRLAPNKALQNAVMALLVTRAHRDPEATLDIVGRPVVPAYTDALHRFVDELGLHGVVRFHGQMSDRALAAAVAGSDVLVLTSVHEGFGVPVVEAMSVGLAVVANRAGALPEILGPGGLLVDTSDPWALADAVAATSDAASRSAMVAGAHAQLRALDLATAGERAIDLISQIR